MTTGQFLERWLNDTAKAKLRPRTWQSYEQVIRLHVVPDLGRVPLQRLVPQHVQTWLNDLAARGLSPRSRAYARAILRSALAGAVKWGLVARNVAALVDAPRVPRYEITRSSPKKLDGF